MSDILEIKGLNVYYGGSHILQNTEMTLTRGAAAVIGRNGMGKTTLMKAIMGIVSPVSGSICFAGEELVGKKSYEIANKGIGYVPQGRHIFPSLTVDEHLKFAAVSKPDGQWDAERVYELFPRLKERYKQAGTNLSGGEQQMLAIGRALVLNPRLLIMDEPSEGLAPKIVEQLGDIVTTIVETGVSLLLVEQQLSFASRVTDQVNVMVTGQMAYCGSFQKLLGDSKLCNRLLGVG